MGMDKNDSEILADRVNSFLSANRKTILGVIGFVVVVVIALVLYFSFSAKKKADDVASVEKIIFELEKEKDEIEKKKKEEESKAKKRAEEEKDNSVSGVVEEEGGSDSTPGSKEEKDEEISPEVLAKEDAVIPELLKVANSSSGYASYLAFYNVADMYFSRKDYATARDYYQKALQAEPNNYISGVLLFNIAVCLEEIGGDDAEVLDYYKKSSMVEDFPLKPRSLFNVARVQEKLKQNEDAIATYKSLIEAYPDNDFAMIGKSRIIALEIKAKRG